MVEVGDCRLFDGWVGLLVILYWCAWLRVWVAAELALLAGGLRELLLVVSVLVDLGFRGYCGCHGWLGASGVGCSPRFLLWILI